MAAVTLDCAPATPSVDDLIHDHLHLVGIIVAQMRRRYPSHVDVDDLRAAGAAGLVDAAHRYDPATGVPFDRYANIRIRGAILDETRTRDWATRRVRRNARELDSAAAQFLEATGREGSDAELAELLDVDVDQIHKRRAAAWGASVHTLDRQTNERDGARAESLADRVVEDTVEWLPELSVETSELVGTLRVAIAGLPETLRTVLVQHQFEGRLLAEIATELGVTEARVSQLRHEALHALQAYFAATYDEVQGPDEAAQGKRQRHQYVARMTEAISWRDRIEAGVGYLGRTA